MLCYVTIERLVVLNCSATFA